MSRKISSYEYSNHPYPVRILFVPNAAAWADVFGQMGVNEEYPTAAARMTAISSTDAGHPRIIVITVNERMESMPWDQIVCAMAHECVHVLQEVEDFVGGSLGDEGQAYLVQDLLYWLTRVYARAGRTWGTDE